MLATLRPTHGCITCQARFVVVETCRWATMSAALLITLTPADLHHTERVGAKLFVTLILRKLRSFCCFIVSWYIHSTFTQSGFMPTLADTVDFYTLCVCKMVCCKRSLYLLSYFLYFYSFLVPWYLVVGLPRTTMSTDLDVFTDEWIRVTIRYCNRQSNAYYCSFCCYSTLIHTQHVYSIKMAADVGCWCWLLYCACACACGSKCVVPDHSTNYYASVHLSLFSGSLGFPVEFFQRTTMV